MLVSYFCRHNLLYDLFRQEYLVGGRLFPFSPSEMKPVVQRWSGGSKNNSHLLFLNKVKRIYSIYLLV